jgi:hypothetical protein
MTAAAGIPNANTVTHGNRGPDATFAKYSRIDADYAHDGHP